MEIQEYEEKYKRKKTKIISCEDFYKGVVNNSKKPSDLGIPFKWIEEDKKESDMIGNDCVYTYETEDIIIGNVYVFSLMGDTYDNRDDLFQLVDAIKTLEDMTVYLKKKYNTNDVEFELKYDTFSITAFWLTASYHYTVLINGEIILEDGLFIPELKFLIEIYDTEIARYQKDLKRRKEYIEDQMGD